MIPFHAVYCEKRSGAATGETRGGREGGREAEDSGLISREVLQMMRVSLLTPRCFFNGSVTGILFRVIFSLVLLTHAELFHL